MSRFPVPDPEALRRRLTPLQWAVTQRDATEPPFHNEFFDHHEAGVYVCVVSGEPLFSSADKFESGTGWPSFVRPIHASAVQVREDRAHGMLRVEVRSAIADTHLGHVFPDGPRPTGMRFCINSAALRFVPAARLALEGYPELVGTFAEAVPAALDNVCAVPGAGAAAGCEATVEVAVLAGGCFWGMEEILRQVPGVLQTEVGYTGGTTPHPDYRAVRTGRTGHAEAIRLVFDPQVLSYEGLLEDWFFLMHDPTTPGRQGNDVGSQYRSAIFTTSDAQARSARAVIARVAESGQWLAPVVTEVVPAGEFTPAEDYHQRYLEGNPGGYTCHFVRRRRARPGSPQ